VGLLDSTQLALQSAMSGSMLRQTLLTDDLANADTPNFAPEDVNFQQTLSAAMAAGQSPTSVAYTPYTQDQVTTADGNGVSTDQTETDISENALLYQDLTQISAARESILQSAMNGGAGA
jgi:flagellar basal-body rod protein FlgB